MRIRDGGFGTVNVVFGVVFGVVFFVVFSALVASTSRSIASGTNVVWSSVAGVVSLVAAVFMARRGFYRDVVAVRDITDVRLAFRSAVPRSGHWQLVVTRRGAPPLYCDSITNSRSPTADVSDTRAGWADARSSTTSFRRIGSTRTCAVHR